MFYITWRYSFVNPISKTNAILSMDVCSYSHDRWDRRYLLMVMWRIHVAIRVLWMCLLHCDLSPWTRMWWKKATMLYLWVTRSREGGKGHDNGAGFVVRIIESTVKFFWFRGRVPKQSRECQRFWRSWEFEHTSILRMRSVSDSTFKLRWRLDNGSSSNW